MQHLQLKSGRTLLPLESASEVVHLSGFHRFLAELAGAGNHLIVDDVLLEAQQESRSPTAFERLRGRMYGVEMDSMNDVV